MPRLSVSLLGTPGIELDGQLVKLSRRKAIALLAYLALTASSGNRTGHSRDSLATLLYPESDQSTARAGLRRALYALRAALGEGWLEVDREVVRLGQGVTLSPAADERGVKETDRVLWLDVSAFRERLAACRAHDHGPGEVGAECLPLLEEATALHRDDFLSGFTLRDSAEFDHWQSSQTQALRDELAGALEQLSRAYAAEGQSEQAIAAARRWLSLDPLHEAAHRRLMILYAQSGQRAAALRQYKACAQTVQEELGVPPQQETLSLANAIRTGALITERERAAPPSPPLELPGHNLPAQVTSFVGRKRELAELGAVLADPEARLTTVVGPGGMGKTRLALQAARRALDRFPAGAWWVDLATVPDDASVPRAVAAVLGIAEPSGRPLSETLAGSLQRSELLLVLDNCEHVVEGAAQLAALLLARCPDLALLATSREPLHVPGERLYPVPPMALPDPQESPERLAAADAVCLFRARARAIDPRFALDEENIAPVADLCRRLDGMPLAIELAAARMRALSLPEIARRLDDRFRLLTGGSRTALPRQQTLRNTIAWSHQLLGEAERTLFDRLSVFAGSFSVEAAEQVCSGGCVLAEEILDGVVSLVDKSLLSTVETEEGRTRYRLLETVRAYGQEMLAARGETEERARRHAWFCVDLAEALEPALFGWDVEMVPAVARLDADADNLAAAMRWSLSSGQPEVALRIGGAVRPWLICRTFAGQYGEWLQRAVTQAGTIAPRVQVKALCALALFAPDDQDPYVVAQEALVLARQAGEPELIGWALYAAGFVGGGRLPREALEEALEIARAEGDRGLLVGTSVPLVMFYIQTPAERKALLEEILPQTPRYLRMWVSSVNSLAALALGQLDEAKRWSEATLSGWTDLGNVARLVHEPLFLARVSAWQGDYDRAYELAQQAADLARRRAQTGLFINATLQMGGVAWLRGDLDQAARLLSEGLELARGQPMFLGLVAEAEIWLALVACEQGAYDRAEALCGEALDRLQKGPPHLTRFALGASARIALCRGDASRAVELYRKCLEGPMRSQHRPNCADSAEHLAWALAADGQAEEAARLLACAAHEREDMGMVLPPVDRPYHERAMEAVQAVLAGRFSEVWAQGEALDVASALAEVHGMDHSP